VADDIPALMRGQYDLCLLTYEKFASLAIGCPHIFEQVGTVVVDEIQMIADVSRGANLEFVLTLLRIRRRAEIEPQLIALSAVIGDTNGLERWLGARLLRRNERPVPLDEGILRADGRFRFLNSSGVEQITDPVIRPEYRKGSSQDWIVPLVRKLVAEGKQVIVFRETKGAARGCALYLGEALGLPPAQLALDGLPATDPSLASTALREALSHGVAFHNSDLDRDERLIIEEQFRAAGTSLRVIAATTTLAMGVNTPAEAVVIAGLEHPFNQPKNLCHCPILRILPIRSPSPTTHQRILRPPNPMMLSKTKQNLIQLNLMIPNPMIPKIPKPMMQKILMPMHRWIPKPMTRLTSPARRGPMRVLVAVLLPHPITLVQPEGAVHRLLPMEAGRPEVTTWGIRQ
jgi:hypothetical protein